MKRRLYPPIWNFTVVIGFITGALYFTASYAGISDWVSFSELISVVGAARHMSIVKTFKKMYENNMLARFVCASWFNN